MSKVAVCWITLIFHALCATSAVLGTLQAQAHVCAPLRFRKVAPRSQTYNLSKTKTLPICPLAMSSITSHA